MPKTDRNQPKRNVLRGKSACRQFRFQLSALCLLAILGCSGTRYMIGNKTLYPADIRTVYVPIIDSTSYRRDLGERLTEAVVREIEMRTPLKVVASPDADSVLKGKIVADTKSVLVRPPTDEQRLTQQSFRVEVSWVDRRGAMLRQTEGVPVPSTVMIDQTANYVVEVGQSISTAQQQAIDKLAQQIVNLMEAPW
jgi:hypothetical protein